jgi:hypothetical protein
MVRQLSFYVWCDLCPAEDRREAVRINVPISIGTVQPRTLDLCELHFKELLQPVLDALYEHGEKTAERILSPNGSGRRRNSNRTGKWREVGPFRCQVDGCVAAPLKHRASFRVHIERLHHMRFQEYVDQFGEPVPLDPEEALGVVEIRCEIGDCDQSYSTATTRWPQMAMVSHMRGRHGLDWRPGQPFAEATRIDS